MANSFLAGVGDPFNDVHVHVHLCTRDTFLMLLRVLRSETLSYR